MLGLRDLANQKPRSLTLQESKIMSIEMMRQGFGKKWLVVTAITCVTFALYGLRGVSSSPPTISTSNSEPLQCPNHGTKRCGSGGFLTLCTVPDEWVSPLSIASGKSAKFYRACKKHDDCYDTYGASRAKCDRAFQGDLEDECDRGFNTVILQPARGGCYVAAKGYYEAVAGAGAGAFSKAQESARAKAQDQIKGFYKDILDREAEQAGIDGWLNALKSGQAIGQVRRGIAESNEAKNKVKDLYRKMLCRESDPDGLKGWINALADGWSLRRVADEGFAGSQEYKNRGGRPCS